MSVVDGADSGAGWRGTSRMYLKLHARSFLITMLAAGSQ